MFFPEESLKRGGKFYLCWVADSWPLRFARITTKQLWSSDVRIICEDLLEVITNESGRPTNRFSLRLSSQLIRGLVRLYQKKATILLGDLCMINANVFKTTNKKFLPVEGRPPLPRLLPRAPGEPREEPDERRVEELLRNSGNVVPDVQDITLKEATIPDFQLPPNDNFGEENPEQALQSLLGERSVELMLLGAAAPAHESGAQLAAEGDTLDKSRAALDLPSMERVSDFDVTLFRKSTTADVLPEFEKDAPAIPDIPVQAVPSDPAPEIATEMQVLEQQIQEVQEPEQVPEPVQEAVPAPEVPPAERDATNIELEVLESPPQARKRRGRSRLIIDKRTKLSSELLRARIDNPRVEMRCEDFSDAIIPIRTPYDMLLSRPAAAGPRLRSNLSPALARLFQRNLGYYRPSRDETQERETEQPRQRHTRSHLEQIVEEQEPPQTEQMLPPTDLQMTRPSAVEEPMAIEPIDANITEINITKDATINITKDATINITKDATINITKDATINITKDATINITKDATINITKDIEVPNLEHAEPIMEGAVPNVEQEVPLVDISELPTQKLMTISQEEVRGETGGPSPPKIARLGWRSIRRSAQPAPPLVPDIVIHEPDKENIPPNTQDIPVDLATQTRRLTAMLMEAGLADRLEPPTDTQPSTAGTQPPATQETRKESGSGSETPLGSLDRTKVSLGDSVKTSDSMKFIRHHWGTEGTMLKILLGVKRGGALDIPRLLALPSAPSGHSRIIAATLFTSILKLKHFGFLRITKNPETLEIVNIRLGARFDDM